MRDADWDDVLQTLSDREGGYDPIREAENGGLERMRQYFRFVLWPRYPMRPLEYHQYQAIEAMLPFALEGFIGLHTGIV